MITTINISLPKSMYEDAQAMVVRRGYSSMSELFRDTLRDKLYPRLTENGFSPEFEEAVLRSAAEPKNRDYVLTTDKEVEDYFLRLKLPKRVRRGRQMK